uniref:ATP synthase F0 subunit 8 n=1 Tax=Pealius mori TaxID=1453199 RepID=A0A7G2CUA6_9HEMI|nr:ATP synthase F0 subunit 8 [Pealius mori]WPM91812.1 ATP synthase F0 subunit 8 [Pealius mori]CAD5105729.1 ATP synthase F0 subunit 8 [Pealius mori]
MWVSIYLFMWSFFFFFFFVSYFVNLYFNTNLGFSSSSSFTKVKLFW